MAAATIRPDALDRVYSDVRPCNVDHAAVKTDDAEWSKLTPLPPMPDALGVKLFDLELGNCACGSTLARYAHRSATDETMRKLLDAADDAMDDMRKAARS